MTRREQRGLLVHLCLCVQTLSMQALYTQASGFNTFENICRLKHHKSYITRKTHKARVTETQRRLYLLRSIKAITIYISELLSKVLWMLKSSEISQHLCVSWSMNSSTGILDPFIWNCCKITDALWQKMKSLNHYYRDFQNSFGINITWHTYNTSPCSGDHGLRTNIIHLTCNCGLKWQAPSYRTEANCLHWLALKRHTTAF